MKEDWTERLTAEELQAWSHELCIARMDELARTIATLRALVETKDGALEGSARRAHENVPVEKHIGSFDGGFCEARSCVVAREALAEDDMRAKE